LQVRVGASPMMPANGMVSWPCRWWLLSCLLRLRACAGADCSSTSKLLQPQ